MRSMTLPTLYRPYYPCNVSNINFYEGVAILFNVWNAAIAWFFAVFTFKNDFDPSTAVFILALLGYGIIYSYCRYHNELRQAFNKYAKDNFTKDMKKLAGDLPCHEDLQRVYEQIVEQKKNIIHLYLQARLIEKSTAETVELLQGMGEDLQKVDGIFAEDPTKKQEARDSLKSMLYALVTCWFKLGQVTQHGTKQQEAVKRYAGRVQNFAAGLDSRLEELDNMLGEASDIIEEVVIVLESMHESQATVVTQQGCMICMSSTNLELLKEKAPKLNALIWDVVGEKMWETVSTSCDTTMDEVIKKMDVDGLIKWLRNKCPADAIADRVQKEVDSKIAQCKKRVKEQVLAKFHDTLHIVLTLNILQILSGQVKAEDSLQAIRKVIADTEVTVKQASGAVKKVEGFATDIDDVATKAVKPPKVDITKDPIMKKADKTKKQLTNRMKAALGLEEDGGRNNEEGEERKEDDTTKSQQHTIDQNSELDETVTTAADADDASGGSACHKCGSEHQFKESTENYCGVCGAERVSLPVASV